ATLQRAAGVQHSSEEALLTLDKLTVQSPSLQLSGQVLGFIGHLTRTGKLTLAAQLLHLVSQGTLSSGESSELFLYRSGPGHRQPPGALPTESSLLLCQLIHSLDGLGEARPGGGARDVATSLQQLIRGRVECVDRSTCLFCAFPEVRVGIRDRVACPL